MKRLNYFTISIATIGIVGAGAVGVASAASNTSTNPDIGKSGIPRTIFREERLEAASQVLNTSTTNIQNAHKDKTFSTLLSDANLTRKEYHQKLKTQLTTDLEAKGYSADQITIALQHKLIVHMRHHHK